MFRAFSERDDRRESRRVNYPMEGFSRDSCAFSFIFYKHTFFSVLSFCRSNFRVEMVLWNVLC